jgi:hypothetical protein
MFYPSGGVMCELTVRSPLAFHPAPVATPPLDLFRMSDEAAAPLDGVYFKRHDHGSFG